MGVVMVHSSLISAKMESRGPREGSGDPHPPQATGLKILRHTIPSGHLVFFFSRPLAHSLFHSSFRSLS